MWGRLLTWQKIYRICSLKMAVMSNTVDVTRVEKYFSQLVRADKLSEHDSRSCRVENASH